MATPLSPPPLTSPLSQKDGAPTHPWQRWFSLLQSVFEGYAKPSGAQAASFRNGWANYGSTFGAAQYRRDAAGVVWLEGAVKSGTVGSPIFTLPADFRPASDKRFIVGASSGADEPGYITVATSGAVTAIGTTTNAFLSLDGIAFPAAG